MNKKRVVFILKLCIRASTNAAANADLSPITWYWDISAHHPSNWQSISLLLAGPVYAPLQSSYGFLGYQDIPEYATIQPFNISTLQLSYIGDLGDGSGDTDNDGLTDWEEIKIYHTDPREADTDGDGLADSYEIVAETNPLDFDTDRGGICRGQQKWRGAMNCISGTGLPHRRRRRLRHRGDGHDHA